MRAGGILFTFLLTLVACKKPPAAPDKPAPPAVVEPASTALPVAQPQVPFGDSLLPPPTDPSSSNHVLLGKPAPALDLPAVSGKGRVALPKGKVVVVFFAVTMAYDELLALYLSQLARMREANKKRGLEVVTVSLTPPPISEMKGFQTYAIDGAETAWSVKKVPSTYVVDQKGIVRLVIDGSTGDDLAGEISPLVEKLLK